MKVIKSILALVLLLTSIDSHAGNNEKQSSKGATCCVGYFGNSPRKLFQPVMIYDTNRLELPGLNKDIPYYFRVDAFNENGITKGK